MKRSILSIRILGLACTTHGFAFATTEGPDRLLDWGRRQPSRADIARVLDAILYRSLPLFVACELEHNKRRSDRGRAFNRALKRVCARHSVMILCVERRSSNHIRPTDQDIAKAAAARFPVIAHKLP